MKIKLSYKSLESSIFNKINENNLYIDNIENDLGEYHIYISGSLKNLFNILRDLDLIDIENESIENIINELNRSIY